jgi:hypothetical protein
MKLVVLLLITLFAIVLADAEPTSEVQISSVLLANTATEIPQPPSFDESNGIDSYTQRSIDLINWLVKSQREEDDRLQKEVDEAEKKLNDLRDEEWKLRNQLPVILEEQELLKVLANNASMLNDTHSQEQLQAILNQIGKTVEEDQKSTLARIGLVKTSIEEQSKELAKRKSLQDEDKLKVAKRNAADLAIRIAKQIDSDRKEAATKLTELSSRMTKYQ